MDRQGRSTMDGKKDPQKQRTMKSVTVKQLVYMTRDRVVFEATDGEYYEIPKEGRTDVEMFELMWGPNWREDCRR